MCLVLGAFDEPDCPPYNYGKSILLPNPYDCATYWECDNGVAILMYCPEDMYYHPELETCDWPWNVKCESSLFRGVFERECRCDDGTPGIRYACEWTILWFDKVPCETDSPCMIDTNMTC